MMQDVLVPADRGKVSAVVLGVAFSNSDIEKISNAMRTALREAVGILRQDGNILRWTLNSTTRPRAFDSSWPSICIQCELRASFTQISRSNRQRDGISRQFQALQRRQWSSHPVLLRDEKPSPPTPEPSKSEHPNIQPANASHTSTESVPLNGSSVHPVPDESLPSHHSRQQWTMTKRFNTLMDSLLPRIAFLSQRINSYTGTDYTGIEALRAEIKSQEALVRARHTAFTSAKQDLEAARATQSASQKEVVGLLERKHGWTPADLERYMSLIRSEHLNEQAVQQAKDTVAASERTLEEARTRLEKRERAQYHEEQIWSDTIRRNSTWVTMGLMGVNILLLLGNVVVLEPWRRMRLVREVRSALEEHKLAVTGETPIQGVESDIDDVVWPAGVPLETLEQEAAARTAAVVADAAKAGEEGKKMSEVGDAIVVIESPAVLVSAPWSLSSLKARVADLFSERIVQVRRIDVTTIAVEGIAAGAAATALAIYILLRPR